MRRVTAQVARAALAVLLLAGSPASPAHGAAGDGGAGDGNGSGSTGYSERSVYAGYLEPPRQVAEPARGLPREPTHYCVRIPVPAAGEPPAATYSPAEILEWARTNTRPPSELPLVACFERDATVSFRVVYAEWNPADPTAGTITTVETVAAYARRLLTVPAPAVRSAPPSARLVTGFETWFDTTATVEARSAQAGPLWATATAVPVAVTLEPEPGVAPIVCALPVERSGDGRPSCLRHTYTRVDPRTGTRTTAVTVRVTYEVQLVTSDDPTPRLVDTFTSPAAETPVTIREIQTVLR